jgi:hypothetical protein
MSAGTTAIPLAFTMNSGPSEPSVVNKLQF